MWLKPFRTGSCGLFCGPKTWHELAMGRARRLVDVYRFPAFRPRAAVRGVFGDPKVRIVRLERRGKKLCVEPAVGPRTESTIASCARDETSRRETPESIWRSSAVGCAAGVAAK